MAGSPGGIKAAIDLLKAEDKLTRDEAQKEAKALVRAQAKQEAAKLPAKPAEQPAPAKVLPATPQPDITKPVTAGPGGDSRVTSQPSTHETLTSVAKIMKDNERKNG